MAALLILCILVVYILGVAWFMFWSGALHEVPVEKNDKENQGVDS